MRRDGYATVYIQQLSAVLRRFRFLCDLWNNPADASVANYFSVHEQRPTGRQPRQRRHSDRIDNINILMPHPTSIGVVYNIRCNAAAVT